MRADKADIIGDIHGNADVLHRLLTKLGYKKKASGSWKHPEGRFVVFLGDFIDRGPTIRETVITARTMCENGDALAVMGNHEHNALCMHHVGEDGKPLRPHDKKNLHQAAATQTAFAGKTDEWESHLRWFQSLPLTLDLGEVRAVHACWDERAIETLKGKHLTDHDVLIRSRTKTDPIGRAILRILNGPELRLPNRQTYADNEGNLRRDTRVRWWDITVGMTLGEIVFPAPNPEIKEALQQSDLDQITLYPADAPLTCFGHYWITPNAGIKPLRSNLYCLDHSIAKAGALACLRSGLGNEIVREFHQ